MMNMEDLVKRNRRSWKGQRAMRWTLEAIRMILLIYNYQQPYMPDQTQKKTTFYAQTACHPIP